MLPGGDYKDTADKSGNLVKKGFNTFQYEPINFSGPENVLADALGSNSALRAIPNFSRVKKVLSLDSDFLGTREPNSTVNTKQFMVLRYVVDNFCMNMFYVS